MCAPSLTASASTSSASHGPRQCTDCGGTCRWPLWLPSSPPLFSLLLTEKSCTCCSCCRGGNPPALAGKVARLFLLPRHWQEAAQPAWQEQCPHTCWQAPQPQPLSMASSQQRWLTDSKDNGGDTVRPKLTTLLPMLPSHNSGQGQGAQPRHLRVQAGGPGPLPRLPLHSLMLHPPPSSPARQLTPASHWKGETMGQRHSPSGRVPSWKQDGRGGEETHLREEATDSKMDPVSAGPDRGPVANLLTLKSPEETCLTRCRVNAFSSPVAEVCRLPTATSSRSASRCKPTFTTCPKPVHAGERGREPARWLHTSKNRGHCYQLGRKPEQAWEVLR